MGKIVKLERYKNNPILMPIKEHSWESRHVSNAGAVIYNNKVCILYRAEGEDNRKSSPSWYVSRMGIAISENGFNIVERRKNPVIDTNEENVPEADGVEDPRITKIGNTYYIVYAVTSYIGDRIALATTKDFNTYTKHGLLMGDISQRTAGLFPEKINGKYLLIHRILPNIWLSETNDFKQFKNSKIILKTGIAKWCELKIGIGPSPIKTNSAWVLFFHGKDRNKIYRVGIAWLDLKDPSKVIKIQKEPVLEPEKDYEKKGFVSNVVYPCGVVERADKILIYYGCCDSVLSVASVNKKEIEI